MVTSKTPMIDEDGEVRELTNSDFKHARKASEAFPGTLQAKLGMLKAKPKAGKNTAARLVRHVGDEANEREAAFSKFADRAKQKYNDELRVAVGKLSIDIEGIYTGESKTEFYSIDTKYLASSNLKLMVYDQLVHSAVDKFSKSDASEDYAVLTWLAGGVAPSKPSQRKLERMRKSRLAELVQVQSEILENFKILLAVDSRDPFELADLEKSLLSEEIDKAGFVKRLRSIAEEVEMADFPPRSRV